MEKQCPHCGAPLPEEASFCPHCAKSVNERAESKPPKRIPAKSIRTALLLLLAVVFCVGIYLYTRPKTYDGLGEVTYTDDDGTYQLVTTNSTNRYDIMTSIRQEIPDDGENYRFPLRFYVNSPDTGADAGGIFLQKVKRYYISIDQEDGSPVPVSCTDPAPNPTYPDAALITFLNWTSESPESSQIVWTFEMKNGDTIRLRMDFGYRKLLIFNYDSTTSDLSDSAALQSLIDELCAIDSRDYIYIQLPAVTYTEPIVISGRAINLTGTEENGKRTTFTNGIQVRAAARRNNISYFTGIDFTGDGTGVGLSVSDRVWAKECRFTGLATGVLSYGGTYNWVNTTDCTFENNKIGLHYNATDGSPSDTRFTGNTFADNGTAVLLENVPAPITMDFSDTVFRGNDTDIDNRCDQPLEISYAIFQ